MGDVGLKVVFLPLPICEFITDFIEDSIDKAICESHNGSKRKIDLKAGRFSWGVK